jgi:hypothetical protein
LKPVLTVIFSVSLKGIREIPFSAVTVCPTISSKWKGIGSILNDVDKNNSIFEALHQMPRDFKVTLSLKNKTL